MKKRNLLLICTLAMINNLHTMEKRITWAQRNADDFIDRAGCTQAHAAAEVGNSGKLIRLITRYPSMINARDNAGRTPLHFACQKGYSSIVHKLLISGADKNAQDKDDFTPLHVSKNREISTILRSFRVDSSLCAKGFITAAQIAPKPFFRKKFRCCLQPFKDFCNKLFEDVADLFSRSLWRYQQLKQIEHSK